MRAASGEQSALHELVTALTTALEAETRALAASSTTAAVSELAVAKQRLTGEVELRLARIERSDAGWIDRLPATENKAWLATIAALHQAANDNAAMLLRQIELSSGLIESIRDEARRVTGRSAGGYGHTGLRPAVIPNAPIAVNARV